MKLTAVAASLFLAGCATPRTDSPDVSFVTARPIEETVPCIIQVLDGAFEGFRHAADTIVPNQQFEIRHHARTFNNQEIYFVRLKKTPENGTEIALYATSAVAEKATMAVGACR